MMERTSRNRVKHTGQIIENAGKTMASKLFRDKLATLLAKGSKKP